MKKKRVKEIMKRDVVSVSENKTIHESAKIMKQKNIGSLMVTRKNKLVGIVTEQDLTRKALAKNLSPKKHKVKEVMSTKVYSVKPHNDMEKAVALMKQKNIEHLPVVKNGTIQGVVSSKDVMSRIYADRYNLLSPPRIILILIVWTALILISKQFSIPNKSINLLIFILAAILIPLYFMTSILYVVINKRMLKNS